VDRSEGPFVDACYFVNHERLHWQWRLALAQVDGIEAIVRFRRPDAAQPWTAHSVVRLAIDGTTIVKVRDYIHVDYLLGDSEVTPIEGSPLTEAPAR
jgi:hypothetical protein